MKVIDIVLIVVGIVMNLAFGVSSNSEIPSYFAVFMEAFVSIHMSIFVLLPFSRIFGGDDSKKWFWKAFKSRIYFLLIFDLFISPMICVADFMFVFVGAFLIVPIAAKIKGKDYGYVMSGGGETLKTQITSNSEVTSNVDNTKGIILKCTKCDSVVKVTDKFCINCGAELTGDNLKVEEDKKSAVIKPGQFDQLYFKSDDLCLEEFLKRELANCGVEKNESLMPAAALKKKKFMITILIILVFVFVSLIFFHFPLLTYAVGLLILFIVYKMANKYDLIKFLSKQVKERPNEKISNIVMNAKMSMVKDETKKYFVVGSFIAVALSLLLFVSPHILYEENGNGYAVRFYTFGLTNFTSAEIPEKYNGKDVISLRGNTFSNMPFLKSVKLPDTIVEIRGQAFKNDFLLSNVNIPEKLEYLGGGAFYNCKSIKHITLPDTLSFMGGEVFYKASSLESITLSSKLTEIRGNSFEECTSLKDIQIPDNVERIGGHAFYGASSLEKVRISENSKLAEIGSSAFRMCSKLYTITIPEGTIVNERAFKESPTSVSRFGEIQYGSLVDSSNYQYSEYMYLYDSATSRNGVIGNYRSNSIAYKNNASISLEYIDIIKNVKYYRMKYSDNNGVVNFDLTYDAPTYKINENVEIEISSKPSYSSSNNLSVKVYYN